MNLRNAVAQRWRAAVAGALACAGLGLLLLALFKDGWPSVLGYDLLFLVSRTDPPGDVTIVYMDNQSFQQFGQVGTPNWDRNIHARLLDQLTRDNARLVVFDVVFSEPGTPEANSNLARAIRDNGKVVLAAAMNYPSRAQISAKVPLLPLPEFMNVAAGWGITEIDVKTTPGRVARIYYPGTESQRSLPEVAATVAGFEVPPPTSDNVPWLNYYGPALSIPNFSYADVSHQAPGWFSNRMVFVGARPLTLKAQDETDEFRTPHSLWRGEYFPGVEIGATAFLNLVRNDGLRRWTAWKEGLLIGVCGLAFGGLLSLLRPLPAGLTAVSGWVLLPVLAIQAALQHTWFAWTVIAFAQIPVALAWSLRCHFHRLKFEKEVIERTLVETSRRITTAAKGTEHGPMIPDHTLVRCVGKGGYGEVWLARNAIGAFHAVKIIQRRAFPSDTPYEREFKGIQKFMPISRSHPGFVNVLHVGRNDASGYFFYIMEAADDQATGQRIDPASYSPKTLASELTRRERLQPIECVKLGLALSDALEHLHQQQLIHRDIKPGNIIYVNGTPKVADIGLITELQSGNEAKQVSLVGTEGYIPPEGPGTPAADVYALGKVLYEACMGRDRQWFPEVPTAIWDEPQDAPIRQLNDVIGKACATQPDERFRSARELHAELKKLEG